jgi:integrase
MPYVRVKGFQIFRDRHGKQRCYHRKTRAAIDLEKYPIGSAEFLAECNRIAALDRQTGPVRPGTLGALITQYRTHSAFQDLAPLTQSDYQRCFDYLQPIADTPLVRFDRPLSVRMRDQAGQRHGRDFANKLKAVVSVVFGWGFERGYVELNPAEKVKNIRRRKDAPRANRPWNDEERYAVLEVAPASLKVPLALSMYCGLRESDALRLTKDAYDGTTLKTHTRKTGQLVVWPVPASLKAILDDAPPNDAPTLAVNSRGNSWTEDGFRTSWRKLRLRLEATGKVAPGLTIHGLRHTVAIILREEGFDERTIADALGQKSETMARHYSRDADLTEKMAAVVKRFDAAENRRRPKVVKST